MITLEIVNRAQIAQVVHDWPITPMTAILFGGERLYWATWGAIARDGQIVCGLATVGDQGEGTGQPTIIGIMVLPDYRRQGIGRQLLAHLVDEARMRELLPLRYDALTPSGLGLASASGYGPGELNVIDQTFGDLELP